MSFQTKHGWQAEKYYDNSGVQQEAALHLLKLLRLKGSENILDVGCGDGKITSAIANQLTGGAIIGSDASEEMIQFAIGKFLPSEKNNLSFVLLNAEDVNYTNQFDLVFSSFAFQWILDIELTLKKIKTSLRSHGRIGFTIPLSISNALEEALADLLENPHWAKYFEGFKLNYYLRDENYYEKLITSFGFETNHFEVVEQTWMFQSREAFELYTLLWLPHLAPLPESLRKEFFMDLMDKYIERVPLAPDGRLSFIFDRVDIIAQKGAVCSCK